VDRSKLELGSDLSRLRKNNSAWQLLASPLAPYVITCLTHLFEAGNHASVEDMEQLLAQVFEENANHEEIDFSKDFLQQARRELRSWIKRRLIIERGGELIPTDDLQRTMLFIDGLQDRIMTSTASRLATVQREIEDLALQLNPDAQARENKLKATILELEAELERVKRGDFQIRTGDSAVEGIREVYDLAMSLRSDFRRVEDSYREAERRLRQSLISDEQDRGQVVEKLLDSHDLLRQTAEGQVFAGFHQQLKASAELERMNRQLREITSAETISTALNHQQRSELKLLTMRLISESKGVIKARARSERDVKGFIKTGLAAEHYRVGRMLNDVLDAALAMDWSSQKMRRTRTGLPLLSVNLNNVPLVERLRLCNLDSDDETTLDLTPVISNLDDIDDEFWQSFDTLDRQEFYDQTMQLLNKKGSAMSVADIASELSPPHDLEAIAFLLGIARETIENDLVPEMESFEIKGHDGRQLRYTIPGIELDVPGLQAINWESV